MKFQAQDGSMSNYNNGFLDIEKRSKEEKRKRAEDQKKVQEKNGEDYKKILQAQNAMWVLTFPNSLLSLLPGTPT